MLYCILNYDWETKEECWNKFKKEYATSVRPYATMGRNPQDNLCTCIAFADRLKDICAAMFGGAVFLATAVVAAGGQSNTDTQSINDQKNKDSFLTVLT